MGALCHFEPLYRLSAVRLLMWSRQSTFLLVVLLVGGCAASTESHGRGMDVGSDEARFLEEGEWPRTCDEAVTWVVSHLDANRVEVIKTTPRDQLIQFHHGRGTGIRNNFGLWRGNRELPDSCLALEPGAQYHPDSVSMIIIEQTWDRLHSQ
jgi:hypothetical protein